MSSARLPARLALVGAVMLLTATGCGSQDTTTRSPANVRSVGLSVRDTEKAFAVEGVPVQRSFEEVAGMPVTLLPRRPELGLFAVTVYRISQASGPLGLRIDNSDHLVVRVRNVVISYSAASPVTAQVQAAVERLRRTRTG